MFSPRAHATFARVGRKLGVLVAWTIATVACYLYWGAAPHDIAMQLIGAWSFFGTLLVVEGLALASGD